MQCQRRCFAIPVTPLIAHSCAGLVVFVYTYDGGSGEQRSCGGLARIFAIAAGRLRSGRRGKFPFVALAGVWQGRAIIAIAVGSLRSELRGCQGPACGVCGCLCGAARPISFSGLRKGLRGCAV